MIRSYVFGLAMLYATTGLIAPGVAHACYIPPDPQLTGETDEAYHARVAALNVRRVLEMQRTLRERSAGIVLMESMRWLRPGSRLRPLSTLKGARTTKKLVLPTSDEPCDSRRLLSMAVPGTRFIVFFAEGRQDESTEVVAIPLDQIVDSDLKAALARKH